jgi:hypothetical protein
LTVPSAACAAVTDIASAAAAKNCFLMFLPCAAGSSPGFQECEV